MIETAHYNLSERDSQAFASALQFAWPYSVRDVYVKNRYTDLYSYSKAFDDMFYNLESWMLISERPVFSEFVWTTSGHHAGPQTPQPCHPSGATSFTVDPNSFTSPRVWYDSEGSAVDLPLNA